MNKSDLIDRIARSAKITKTQANQTIDTITKSITQSLKKGGRTTLVGFGAFAVSRHKARTGRNPQTGAPINIPARRVPKFIAGKALRKAVR
ncbi:MAG: HU family DNA-binding protein [Acidobacteria bacterium]|nr:HU family DNA-binding protein [Acidobacteriota bacterium]